MTQNCYGTTSIYARPPASFKSLEHVGVREPFGAGHGFAIAQTRPALCRFYQQVQEELRYFDILVSERMVTLSAINSEPSVSVDMKINLFCEASFSRETVGVQGCWTLRS
jgi:hypothetical protein